jgi:DNA-binding SARP family transcriptional activator/basic membrane lipoprotein Med (substrate-binding protein (PBP1-ABC) superfamily)
VTKRGPAVELHVLGPLEVRIDGDPLALGGSKQLTLLAALLVHAGEVVSLQRLIDELWGDSPPQSAPHSLEAYVSRLRRVLAASGSSVDRRGAGYSLDLGDASLDAQDFAERAADASRAAGDGDHERASQLARDALALWRGPALADVSLGPAGHAERERLEELRLRTLEQRFEAELALGRDEELVGELQVLVGQNLYRERFVSQLMLALYRSGRQADALEVYERTRAVLADDLGLQPSEELQQLSGRIVRQEPQLARPTLTAQRVTRKPAIRSKPRTVALVFGAAIALAIAFTTSGSAPHGAIAASAPDSTRVALVLPRAPDGADRVMTLYRNRLRADALDTPELKTETIVVDEIDTEPAALARVASRLRNGRFGLVLWVGDGSAAQALTPLVRSMPGTRFTFVDASLETLSLHGVANASAVRFAEEEPSELVGYLSGLVAPRGRPAQERVDVVGLVGGIRTAQLQRIVTGFVRGVGATRPQAAVLVDFANETEDRTVCEQIANSQISRGADVLFVVAGKCGSGALAVARARGVWAVGSTDYATTSARTQMLGTTYKEYEWGIDVSVERFRSATLPRGHDLVLRLNDDYAVGFVNMNVEIAPAAVSQTIHHCSEIRQRMHDATN